MNPQYRYRSFFWPAVLILIGVVALLVNTDRLSVDRLVLLAGLWPLILIVVGLELIVRRSVHGQAGDLAAALIILLAVGGAAAYVFIAPNPAATRTLDATGEVGSIAQGSAEIDAAAATITVSGSGELGSKLYRAHVEYSGSMPDVQLDSGGKLTISQQTTSFLTFQNPRFVVQLDLNPAVPWMLEINTAASNITVNVPQVHLSRLSINTAASREEITLGPPSGVVPVEVDGGALTVHVHRPSKTPVSVSVSGGALNLTADGKTSRGIGVASYDSPGFASATDAYRIQVNGGACTVTVDSATRSD